MQEAAICVLRALQSQIPPTSIQIEVQAASARSMDYAQGDTDMLDPKLPTVIRVALDHPHGARETAHGKFARFAFTLTHELHLHALPYIGAHEAAARGQSFHMADEDQQHESIYSPANDNNAYFQAVRSVLPELPESARPVFVKEYLRDLHTYITVQAGNGGMAAAARGWAERVAQSFGYADLASGVS